eukprot:PhM_4_TR4918/c0_g1_i1/m.96892
MVKRNALAEFVHKLNSFPEGIRSPVMSFMLGRKIPFVSTSSVVIDSLNQHKSIVSINNRKKVQNHIGGVHACAMTLVAETATGILFGMTVPDTHIPLCKSIKVDFVRRAEGGLTAQATLNENDIKKILSSDKGDLVVPCIVRDDSGKQPIKVECVWAWAPKNRGKKPAAEASEDKKEDEKPKQE